MAKTFKDFITECEIYPHSQEHFELVKECSEVALTEMFIENQEFMMENAALLSGGITFTEGYLQESVDEGTMDVMMEKFQIKKDGILDKIMTGLHRIVNVFWNLCRKMSNHFDTITTAGQEARNKLANAKIDDEDISALKKIVAGVKNRDGAKFPVAPKQPYLDKIKLGKYLVINPEVQELKNDLAAALSNKTVIAQVVDTGKSGELSLENIGAIPAEAIKDAAWRLTYGDRAMLFGVSTSLVKAWTDAHDKGMVVKVGTKDIDRIAADLQKISDKIDEIGKEKTGQPKTETSNDTGTGSATAGNEATSADSEYLAVINKVYTAITTSIGQTMKIYTSLNAYRSGVIAGLESFLKDKGPSEEK